MLSKKFSDQNPINNKEIDIQVQNKKPLPEPLVYFQDFKITEPKKEEGDENQPDNKNSR